MPPLASVLNIAPVVLTALLAVVSSQSPFALASPTPSHPAFDPLPQHAQYVINRPRFYKRSSDSELEPTPANPEPSPVDATPLPTPPSTATTTTTTAPVPTAVSGSGTPIGNNNNNNNGKNNNNNPRFETDIDGMQNEALRLWKDSMGFFLKELNVNASQW